MAKLDKNELPNIEASQFEFVNNDPNRKIHDEKFETKPTTFAKDALKRFAKNKSSVVGAVIIGVLLLGSFLSFLSPHDISTANADERLLAPKLFENTGWWDGTLPYSGVAYSVEDEAPVGFDKQYVKNLQLSGETYIDQIFEHAKGGYLTLRADSAYYNESWDIDYFSVGFENYTPFAISQDEDLSVKIVLGDEDPFKENTLVESYTIELVDGGLEKSGTVYTLQAPSTNFGELNFNLSQFLKDNSIDSIENAHLYITGTPKLMEQPEEGEKEQFCYLMIKTVEFTSSNAEKQELLDQINMVDATATAFLMKDSAGIFPVGYWKSYNCVKDMYHAITQSCTFRYDIYGKTFGDQVDFVIGESLIKKYIQNGWCEFTDFNDVSTFKVLDADKCPIKEVTSIKSKGPYQFNTITTYYKFKGYSAPPKYIFGTDAEGHDLLTVALSSLKTSLLVAIISSAACLIIGLIWGSISGYFGGNVDIIMERITDILGGVPWIVMMTLIILLLGNNVVTFAIALIMTGWIGTSSRTRTQFYRFKGREYILASRTLGASDARLIFRHILPNGLGTIVTGSVLMIPSCIFSEASISYLGLGLQGVDSFGVLLSENQVYLSTRPLLVIIPAIIISLLMISFNLFGNGLRDALNPTLKGGE